MLYDHARESSGWRPEDRRTSGASLRFRLRVAAKALLFYLARLVRPALVVAALVLAWRQLSDIAAIFASRLTYPMDIEWMEGGALLHAYRLLHKLPVYGPPGQGFLPYPYPPGHIGLLAIAARYAGLDYATGRAVSIFFFVVACGALFYEVWLHFRPARDALVVALAAVAGMVASYPVVGGWYDLVRNDSMEIALVVLGAAILSDRRPSPSRVLAGALMLTLAVFTKQTAVFFIAWLCLVVFKRSRPAGFWLAAWTLAACVLWLVLEQRATENHFWFWTIKVMSKHHVERKRVVEGLKILLRFAPFAPAIPVVAAALAFRKKLSSRAALWTGMYLAALPASLLPFAKAGGYLNNLIPIILLSPPVALLLWGDVVKAVRFYPALARGTRWMLLGGAALFLFARAVPRANYFIDADKRARAERTNAQIAALDGGVVIPSHPFLATRNHFSTPQFIEMPYEDALGARVPGLDLPGYLRAGKAKWAILSGNECPAVRGWIEQLYKFVRPLDKPSGTLTGFGSSPRDLFELRPVIKKKNVRVVFDFESGKLDGWKITGNSFEKGVWGDRGGRHVNTWHPTLGDGATGVAVSPPFTIDRTHLGLLVGGGKSNKTRLEISIDGKVVFKASGVDSEALIPMDWDVRAYRGKSATLSVIDEEPSGWGHILVDQVELYDE